MQYLKIADVVRKTTLSQSTIRRMVRADKFPQPRAIADGFRSVFIEQEIDDWMLRQVGAA